MKKLKFNNGGQPIFLDDLQTLQNSMNSAVCAIVEALLTSDWSVTGVTAAFLSDPTRSANGGYVSGWLYYDGNLLQYTNNLTPALIVPSGYINIYKTEADTRVMQDGTSATCTETMYATVDSAQDAQALASFSWKTLPVLTELVSQEHWKSDYVTLENGYSGTFRWANEKWAGMVRMRASLSSTANSWEDARHIVVKFSTGIMSGKAAKKCISVYNGDGKFFIVYYNDDYNALCVECDNDMTPKDCPMQWVETLY